MVIDWSDGRVREGQYNALITTLLSLLCFLSDLVNFPGPGFGLGHWSAIDHICNLLAVSHCSRPVDIMSVTWWPVFGWSDLVQNSLHCQPARQEVGIYSILKSMGRKQLCCVSYTLWCNQDIVCECVHTWISSRTTCYRFSVRAQARETCSEIMLMTCLMCVCRCLAHIRELLDILTYNHSTIIAREHIPEETESDKFSKVLISCILVNVVFIVVSFWCTWLACETSSVC